MAIEEAAPRLTLTDAPGDRAQAIIRTGLSDYNLEQAGYRDARTLAVLVSDPDTQEVIGGLLGRTSFSTRSIKVSVKVCTEASLLAGERVLALHWNSVRRSSIVSRADARREGSGLRPGFWPTGPVKETLLLCGAARAFR